jgi:glycosyltransferase involved in cell wall biosynthesis
MKIAFYAPLKHPDHPVPSGDRQMARLLVAALTHAGHIVDVASHMRSLIPEPTPAFFDDIEAQSRMELRRLSALWQQTGTPDFWFTYHPYYKAPDLVGLALAAQFHIPYATAEASHSARRNTGVWSKSQALVVNAVTLADVNFCFTRRDWAGLAAIAPQAKLEMLAPFIDTSVLADSPCRDTPNRLVSVAMMRKGDKFESFRMLAQALPLILDLPWTLSVVGDGNMRETVEQLFGEIPANRIEWLGQIAPDRVLDILQKGGIYVWPGYGEAYGLAYLEAQGVGLPVVAQAIAGVPEVVQHGVTGILTSPGDVGAFAQAVRRLLTDDADRQRMARAARAFVNSERTLHRAAVTLNRALERAVAGRRHDK